MLTEFLLNISGNIITESVVIIFAVFRNRILRIMRRIYHSLTVLFTRKRYVLIWNDDDIAHSRKISKNLEKKYPSIRFKSLDTPKEIFNFTKKSSVIQTIIFIVSDVTKLSEDKKVKEEIQTWLVDFLGKDGGIIGTHDLIYRRVRNDKLEIAFGCQLNNFKRIEGKVRYIKNPAFKNHKMLKDLPDSFELDDGEILWGKWREDENTTCLFQTEGENPKPLVVAREYSRGRAVWINSGDKKDNISKSISQPEENFVGLLGNAIDWISEHHIKYINKKLIIAHRGASANAKENSMDALRKSIQIGADMIEFDVRRTKDDIFIAYHDEFINNNPINEILYDEIKKIDNDILTVEEILGFTKGKIKLDVELKEEGYEEEIIELLLRYFKKDEFVITSFNDTSLKKIKSRYPNLRVGLLLGKDKSKNPILTQFSELFPIKRAIQAKADFLVPNWKLLKLGFLKRARKNNMPVFVWTVNDEEMIKEFLNNNLIEAIITDKPDIAVSLQTVSPNNY